MFYGRFYFTWVDPNNPSKTQNMALGVFTGWGECIAHSASGESCSKVQVFEEEEEVVIRVIIIGFVRVGILRGFFGVIVGFIGWWQEKQKTSKRSKKKHRAGSVHSSSQRWRNAAYQHQYDLSKGVRRSVKKARRLLRKKKIKKPCKRKEFEVLISYHKLYTAKLEHVLTIGSSNNSGLRCRPIRETMTLVPEWTQQQNCVNFHSKAQKDIFG